MKLDFTLHIKFGKSDTYDSKRNCVCLLVIKISVLVLFLQKFVSAFHITQGYSEQGLKFLMIYNELSQQQ